MRNTYNPLLLTSHFPWALLFLGEQLNSLVMYVVSVSATLQISSANVTSRRPPTLQRGFLLTVSTPCMRNYQRQGHTPPPGATAAYRNSVLPALPRLLVDRNAELNYYIQELS